jgi:hypothetical protein
MSAGKFGRPLRALKGDTWREASDTAPLVPANIRATMGAGRIELAHGGAGWRRYATAAGPSVSTDPETPLLPVAWPDVADSSPLPNSAMCRRGRRGHGVSTPDLQARIRRPLRNSSGPISRCLKSDTKMPSGRRANSRARWVLRMASGSFRRSSPSQAQKQKPPEGRLSLG